MTAIATPELLAAAPPPANGIDTLYEIVNDQYVELPPMSTRAVMIASLLLQGLGAFARANQLGRVVQEMLFGLDPNGKLRRRPDVAFVSYGRWAKGRRLPDTDPWMVIPDLAVEVVSPTDQAEELRVRVRDYFQAGVQQVWVVYPKLELVDVYESLTHVRGRTLTEELEGGSVLPNFRLPVAAIFEEEASE
jgi:Uma2 family endonuclease